MIYSHPTCVCVCVFEEHLKTYFQRVTQYCHRCPQIINFDSMNPNAENVNATWNWNKCIRNHVKQITVMHKLERFSFPQQELKFVWDAFSLGRTFCLPPAFMLCFLLGFCFDPEDRGNMFLRNVGWLQLNTRGHIPEDRILHKWQEWQDWNVAYRLTGLTRVVRLQIRHSKSQYECSAELHNLPKHSVKGKDVPVTGLGGPYGCERSRLPHYLDKRLTEGGKIVNPTRRPPFTPRFLFSDSWYSFLLEAESTPGS
jgi:hypothetical protein